MMKNQTLERLRAHQSELKALGVEKLSVFGSTARGDAGEESDVDVVVRLTPANGGFRHFGRIERIRARLQTIVGRPVDIVVEPVRAQPLREAIEREAAPAF
jgi:hypothetical protein